MNHQRTNLIIYIFKKKFLTVFFEKHSPGKAFETYPHGILEITDTKPLFVE